MTLIIAVVVFFNLLSKNTIDYTEDYTVLKICQKILHNLQIFNQFSNRLVNTNHVS